MILSNSSYQSFQKAKEFCESLPGSLLTIPDQAEQGVFGLTTKSAVSACAYSQFYNIKVNVFVISI